MGHVYIAATWGQLLATTATALHVSGTEDRVQGVKKTVYGTHDIMLVIRAGQSLTSISFVIADYSYLARLYRGWHGSASVSIPSLQSFSF